LTKIILCRYQFETYHVALHCLGEGEAERRVADESERGRTRGE
jgi:hypothetical protein